MKKNLVILGGGESGVGAALLGKHLGYNVFLSDKGELKDKYRDKLIENEIYFEEETHTLSKILNADLVIKSPGIPNSASNIQQIHEKNIQNISEVKFASQYKEAKIIAITGSNGKTTTATLVYQILKDAGCKVALAGNIGNSFAELVVKNTYEYYVLRSEEHTSEL